MTWNYTFRATEKYEIMLKLSILLQFFKSNNLKSSYWKIIAQTNKQVLCFGKIHFICYMNNRVTILTVVNFRILRAQLGKNTHGHIGRKQAWWPHLFIAVFECPIYGWLLYQVWKKIWVVHPFQGNYLKRPLQQQHKKAKVPPRHHFLYVQLPY